MGLIPPSDPILPTNNKQTKTRIMNEETHHRPTLVNINLATHISYRKMGQTLGRAPLPPGCKRFLNLPRSCIYDLWEAFNDIAEGFGLTIDEFQEILKSALMEYLAVTERTLNGDTDLVFRAYDDDENNLVDSLEFLSSFALLSGMTPEEKIRCK